MLLFVYFINEINVLKKIFNLFFNYHYYYIFFTKYVTKTKTKIVTKTSQNYTTYTNVGYRRSIGSNYYLGIDELKKYTNILAKHGGNKQNLSKYINLKINHPICI